MQIKQPLTTFLRSRTFQLLLVSFAILAIIPILVNDTFFLHVFTLIFVFAIYASSWNFLSKFRSRLTWTCSILRHRGLRFSAHWRLNRKWNYSNNGYSKNANRRSIYHNSDRSAPIRRLNFSRHRFPYWLSLCTPKSLVFSYGDIWFLRNSKHTVQPV